MPKLTATYLYSGMPDYWGGDGRRWDDDAGCVFAYYSTDTTLRDLIDSAVSDWFDNGDFITNDPEFDAWEDVTEDDVRAALLDCLSEQGRADYESGALSEFAVDYADANGYEAGEPEPEDDVCCDSPVVIFLLEVEVDDDDSC